MRARQTRAAVAALITLLAGLTIGLAMGDSAAQTSATSTTDEVAPAAQTALVEPQVVTGPGPGVPTTSATTPTATDAPDQVKTVTTTDEVTGEVTSQVLKPATVSGAAVGNAALAPTADKRVEAKRSCAAGPDPTNPLLSVGSAVAGRPRRSLTWLFLPLAILATVVALGTTFLRHRNQPTDGEVAPPSPLETTSKAVAILSGLSTLAVIFFGVGVKDHPPPAAHMTVREVHARITHGAYADKMRGVKSVAPAVSEAALGRASGRSLDRLEIGNVVWLELRLTGYRDTRVHLQWALFEAPAGGSVIPNTEHVGELPVDDDSDVHSEFLPIWVGSPRVPRFRVEFRLLDNGRVRQIASTDKMRGITYRYAC